MDREITNLSPDQEKYDGYVDGLSHYDERVANPDFAFELFKVRFEQYSNRVTEKTLNEVEDELDLKFGSYLRRIYMEYGKLTCYYVDMLGVYNDEPRKSEMVKQTKYFRMQSRKLNDQFVISIPNDAFAICCDTDDCVSIYSRWDDKLININMNVLSFFAGEGLHAIEWAESKWKR